MYECMFKKIERQRHLFVYLKPKHTLIISNISQSKRTFPLIHSVQGVFLWPALLYSLLPTSFLNGVRCDLLRCLGWVLSLESSLCYANLGSGRCSHHGLVLAAATSTCQATPMACMQWWVEAEAGCKKREAQQSSPAQAEAVVGTRIT